MRKACVALTREEWGHETVEALEDAMGGQSEVSSLGLSLAVLGRVRNGGASILGTLPQLVDSVVAACTGDDEVDKNKVRDFILHYLKTHAPGWMWTDLPRPPWNPWGY